MDTGLSMWGAMLLGLVLVTYYQTKNKESPAKNNEEGQIYTMAKKEQGQN